MSPGRFSRQKGVRAEREVVGIFRAAGFADARRTPNSGGLAQKGDITGVPGFHIECKRQETLCVPKWLRQAHADAGGDVPLLVFRTNAAGVDPLGHWHVVVPLDDFVTLLPAPVALKEAA